MKLFVPEAAIGEMYIRKKLIGKTSGMHPKDVPSLTIVVVRRGILRHGHRSRRCRRCSGSYGRGGQGLCEVSEGDAVHLRRVIKPGARLRGADVQRAPVRFRSEAAPLENSPGELVEVKRVQRHGEGDANAFLEVSGGPREKDGC